MSIIFHAFFHVEPMIWGEVYKDVFQLRTPLSRLTDAQKYEPRIAWILREVRIKRQSEETKLHVVQKLFAVDCSFTALRSAAVMG
jgi:hypothetical protein